MERLKSSSRDEDRRTEQVWEEEKLDSKKQRAAMEDRGEGCGRENSDLITMIGDEATVCGGRKKLFFSPQKIKHMVFVLSSRKPTQGHDCTQQECVAFPFIFFLRLT